MIGVVAFGFSFAALIVAAAVYVSSSAVAVKGLMDFRRLADDETDLVLAILVFEDIAIAFVLAIAGGGGGEGAETLGLALKALLFITASLAASRWLARPIDLLLDRLPREFFLLVTFALVIGMSAIAHALDLSEAIGALMAGVILAETSVREEIEERFFSFRDLFAALFFFVFGLTIDVASFSSVGWLVALAVVLTVAAKLGSGFAAGRVGGFTPRQSLNVGDRARRPRRVHDHPGADRGVERDALAGGEGRPRRLRRPLRARDRDDRRHPDEGVQDHRPASVRAARTPSMERSL